MKIKIRDTKFFFAYCFCLLMLVRPAYLETLTQFRRIYDMCFPLVTISVTVCFLYQTKKRYSINKTVILICAFIGLPVVFSVIKGVGISFSYIRAPINWLVLVLLLAMGYQVNFEQTLKAVAFILGMYVIINFVSIVLFPDALYSSEIYYNSNWFLGYKNVMVRTMLPALAANAVYFVYKKGRFTIIPILLFVLCLASEVLVDCKTGALGIIMFGVLIYIFREGEMPKYINLKTIGIFILILYIALTVFDLADMFEGYIIYLGKKNSMGNRFLIWKRSIELICKSPIIGYGYRTTEGMRTLLNYNIGWAFFSHPHNYLLYILLQGGAVLFALGVYLYGRIGQICLRHRKNFTSKVVLALYVSFLVMGLTESLVGATMLYPMMLLVETMKEHNVTYTKKHYIKQNNSNYKRIAKNRKGKGNDEIIKN